MRLGFHFWCWCGIFSLEGKGIYILEVVYVKNNRIIQWTEIMKVVVK